MIFVVTRCDQCPFMSLADGGRTCGISSPRHSAIPDGEQRPSWCGLRSGQKNVRDFPGAQTFMVVSRCDECPFLSTVEGRRVCNVGPPAHRPIPDEDDRPFWCRMRKEQIIVRDFK
jgi:hypothetical protein